jgi:hypothetical protein
LSCVQGFPRDANAHLSRQTSGMHTAARDFQAAFTIACFDSMPRINLTLMARSPSSAHDVRDLTDNQVAARERIARALDALGGHPADIDAFCDVWFRNRKDSTPGEHKRLNAILDQGVERFKGLDEEKQEEFKVKLVSFRNLYTFLSQIIPYQDSDLEKLYTYGRFLLLKLPRRKSGLG